LLQCESLLIKLFVTDGELSEVVEDLAGLSVVRIE
jgi:hypothetical protein